MSIPMQIAGWLSGRGRRSPFSVAALAVVALLLVPGGAGTAQAADATYRVDLIVFVDLWHADAEAGAPAGAPNLQGAIRPDDVAALRAAGIEILPDEQFGLDDEWKHLRYSKQFKPLLRLAWTQRNPPEDRGPAIAISAGESTDPTSPAARAEGSVALRLSRYLHVDADLQYVENGLAWKLDERRRMKRDEVHHLDSPRLGLLARVTRVGGDAAP